VGDPLARDLRRRGKKLRVPLSRGVLVVDFSDHIDHLEVQSGPVGFLEGPVAAFFRDLELVPVLPGQLLELHRGELVRHAFVMKRLQLLEARVFGPE